MDSFEAVVAAILQRQGYWTQTSVKVELTKPEKVEIGRHSSPRWELDVVGYRRASNELLVMECKSFLDSPGVQCSTFDGRNQKNEKSYKLFFEPTLRRVVLNRLEHQLIAAGSCPPEPTVRPSGPRGRKGTRRGELAPAALRQERVALHGAVADQEGVRALRDCGYENTVAAVVAKLLLRES